MKDKNNLSRVGFDSRSVRDWIGCCLSLPGKWKLITSLLLLLTLGIGQVWGADLAETSLVSSNFASATVRAYVGNQNCAITGEACPAPFTELYMYKSSSCDVAVNSETGGGSRDVSGKLQAYLNNTSKKWSWVRSSNLATTAPEVLHIKAVMLYDKSLAGSAGNTMCIAVGNEFTDGMQAYPDANKVVAGFSFNGGNTKINKYAAYGTSISGSNEFTNDKEFTLDWYINNSASKISYTDPNGTSHELAAGCFDIWVDKVLFCDAVDKSTNGVSGTTMQNLYIGSNGSSTKKHEFVLSSINIYSLSATSGGGGGEDPVDPVFTYTGATYTIGDDALDLSTKLTSTNTTGAITFAVSTADAGTTGASIANNKNFTATDAGTAKVTVSQAASTGFNAKSQDIEVTVVEPDPCHKYFWFSKAGDVPTGVTNNESDFFGGTLPSGSGSLSGSFTIDGIAYTLTQYSSSKTPTTTFTVPSGKSGKLYAVVKSGGSGRTVDLKKGTTTIQSIEWETLATAHDFNPVGPGTYTITSSANMNWAMFVVKICDAEYHTITLDLDGGTGATSVQALDGAPATKPADPTKEHCTFAGWYKGSDEYDWTTAVTTPFTLTAHWTQLYTVTYAAGDGTATGDAPTQADLAAGEKFNVAANTFAVAGKDFDKWNDGANDYNPGDEYTVGTANVVLTAQWKAAAAKYTVIFKDGETTLGSKQFEVGSNPSDAEIDKTKALSTFAAWQKDEADIALDAAFWATVAKDATVTLNARWAKVYVADDASFDFQANTTLGEITVSTTKAEVSGNVGNMLFSAMDIQYGQSGEGAFYGWKIKEANATIRFYVENDRRLQVTLGDAGSNAGFEIAYTVPGASSVTNANLANNAVNTYDVAAGTLVTLTTKNTANTVTLQSIVLSDIPALSDDATLSDLTLKYGTADAATISGFSSAKQTYYVEVPYGTAKADLPIVGATATDATNALVTISQAKDREDWKTVIRVQAEDRIDDHDKYYEVRFNVLPKLGVELIKVVVPAGTQNDTEATGYFGGTGDTKNEGNSLKIGGGCYAGVVLTTEKTFKAGDVINIHTSAVSTSGGSVIKIYADNSASTLLYNTETIGGDAAGNNFFVLPEAVNNVSSLYVVRTDDNKWNGSIDYIAVYRLMAPFIEEFKIGDAVGTINQDLKTIAVEVPYSTDITSLTPTIKAWANGGATLDKTGAQDFSSAVVYKVSSAYEEDGEVAYTVNVTKTAHYEAQIGTTSYATLAAAVAVAQADDVVKLLDNVDLMATGLTIAENITLDLNGFNIKAGEQIDNDILVPAGKKLTLVDNSANAEGKIYTEQAYTGAVTGYGLIRVAGELLMQSGNIYAVIESDPANLGQFAVVVAPAGKVTVAGGQIKAGWYAISNSGNNTGSTIIVSGGELISTADFAIYNPAKESTVTVSGGVVYGAAGGIAMNRGELTVTGGTITSKDQGTTGTWGDGTGGLSNAAIAASGKYESVEVEISGGTIIAEGTAVMITNGTTNPVEVAISGGQFSHVVPAEYCADGFAPVTTTNAQGKYEVYAVGIIHAAATQNSDNIYMCTLDNNVKIYASNSEGKLSTSTMTSTSSDVTACGGDAGGFNVNKSAFVLQFPVNVKEFTLFGANSNERTISKVYVNAEASADIKISTVGRELTGAYSNTKDEKCQTLTAVFAGENIIPANEYVLVTLSGSVNFYRVLYTEAECTTPTVAVADQAAKENVAVTLTAEANALGATYQWYTCDDALGTNPVIIAGKTAKTLSVTKVGTADQYYKVVVGCNCSAETASAVATVSLYTEATSLVDVTENTVWDWTEVTNDVDGAAITSDGKTVNGANGILANYLQGADWNKLESNNGAYAIRSNSNKYYQGASLHMHTTVPGMLKINARNDGNGMDIVVNGRSYRLTNSFKDYEFYVQAGDVTISNDPDADGNPMRIAKITFTVKETPDYTRNEMLGNGVYGTICLPNNVPAGAAFGATFYEFVGREPEYGKLVFDEITNGALEAGKPYVFQAHGDEINIFYGETHKDAPVNSNGMYGTFSDTTLYRDNGELDGIYYFAQKALWSCDNAETLTIPANRAYVKLVEMNYINNSNPAPGRKRVMMEVNGEKVATGIDAVNLNTEKAEKIMIDGQMYILRGSHMFDATGRLVK